MLNKFIRSLFFLGLSYSSITSAAIDNAAAIVELRTSCNELNSTIDNCFTSLDSLNSWIQGTRTPDSSDPLAVRIGPGEFPGTFVCVGNQHISLIGSGSSSTVLKKSTGLVQVMTLKDNCNLNVQDLKIDNIGGLAAIKVDDQATSTFNILSTWSNVEVISTGYTWVEEHCDPAITDSKHFWKGSKLTSVTRAGVPFPFAKAYVSCAENWFHATEITAIKNFPTNFPQATALLVLGETHVYGGVIRAIAGPGISGDELPDPAPYASAAGPQGLVGIYVAGSGADLHMHGAGIDVLSAENNNIAGILTESNARVHVMESAFNMSSCGASPGCSGTLQRIASFGGTIRSSFQWENGTEPPNISSQNGADTFVETDCAATGCQTIGGQPHMLIYSTECTGAGGNWFDTVTGSCR